MASVVTPTTNYANMLVIAEPMLTLHVLGIAAACIFAPAASDEGRRAA